MFFITPILAGIILVGTLGVGAYVRGEARDVISQYNLSQIAHVLEIYNVDYGKYPDNLADLVMDGEIKNLSIGQYKYEVSADLQKYSLQLSH